MAYRTRIYVAFDGDTDIHYYYLMKAWTKNENFDFEINDAHDINYAQDSSQEVSIKAKLRVALDHTETVYCWIKVFYYTRFPFLHLDR